MAKDAPRCSYASSHTHMKLNLASDIGFELFIFFCLISLLSTSMVIICVKVPKYIFLLSALKKSLLLLNEYFIHSSVDCRLQLFRGTFSLHVANCGRRQDSSDSF